MKAEAKKFELTDEVCKVNGVTLRRIRALRDINLSRYFGFTVTAGSLGGWVESERNLSHVGESWIRDEAKVFGGARVSGNALVEGSARVYGRSRIHSNAVVCGTVYDSAVVSGETEVNAGAKVFGAACIKGRAYIGESAQVYGNAIVCEEAQIGGHALISGYVRVATQTHIGGDAVVESFQDFISVGPLGSRNDALTVARGKNGLVVCTGCFTGSVDEFLESVVKKHGCAQHGLDYYWAMGSIENLFFD